MLFLTLLLVPFFQVASCEPLMERDSGCIVTTGPRPTSTDCHQVIDAFSQSDPSGYITLEGKATKEIVRGFCGATLFNKLPGQARINEASLAFDMTANIFNPCIVNNQWGRSENDNYSIRLYHVKVPVSKRGKEPQDDVQVSASLLKRAEGHAYCTAYISGPPPPVPAECLQAIDGITNLGSKPFLEVYPVFCVRHAVGGCWAHVCNNQNHKIELDKGNVKSLFMEGLFNPCITKGNYGIWFPDTNYFSLALFEPPQQKMFMRGSSREGPELVPLAEVDHLVKDLHG